MKKDECSTVDEIVEYAEKMIQVGETIIRLSKKLKSGYRKRGKNDK